MLLGILIIYGMGNSVFELEFPFSSLQSSLVSDLKFYLSTWSCSHCGFAANYPQCRSPILKRMIRDQVDQHRSHHPPNDTYVLFWMSETLSMLIAFTLQRTEQCASRRTDDTRVDGCLSGRGKKLGLLPIKSELRAHQMAPGGVIAHQRSRRALQLVLKPNGKLAFPLRDGDKTPS